MGNCASSLWKLTLNFLLFYVFLISSGQAQLFIPSPSLAMHFFLSISPCLRFFCPRSPISTVLQRCFPAEYLALALSRSFWFQSIGYFRVLACGLQLLFRSFPMHIFYLTWVAWKCAAVPTYCALTCLLVTYLWD